MPPYHQQLVVQPYRPGRRRMELILWVLSTIVLFTLGLILGSQIFSTAMLEKQQQQLELSKLHKEVVGLEQRLANAQMANRVDSVALEQVRKLVASLQTQHAADKEELSLYHNLLQSGGVGDGLLIGELVLRQAEGEQSIAYRLVIQQKKADFKPMKVAVAMTIKGMTNGEEQSLGLDLLDSEIEALPIQIEFKYFHLFEGVITLPPGFVPAELKAEVWKKGASKSRVERSFDWRVD